jgi:carbonic anhydrase
VRNQVPERGFLGSWLTLLDGLRIVESDGFAYDEETAFELAGVRSSLVKLRDFPFVRKREQAGLLALHGLHFDRASGSLLALDEADGSFAKLPELLGKG